MPYPLKPNTKYLSWEKHELEALLLKEPNLQQAFEASIARDLASKLSTSQSQIKEHAEPSSLV